MELPLILGIIGTTILVVTFFLNEHHKLTVDDFTFDFLHLIGSACLMVYAIYTELTIFVILNGLAALISLIDVVKSLRDKPRSRTKTTFIKQKRPIKK
ncbi:hypothetical protein HOE31_00515 [bacterium]|jgi:lipid-A-disaccharide synthase-like uncharacterized protein|nr:hypothetical protein [bacterium]MBT4121416.1 hypothetical protein [bacterium]MBT4334944.1 hypothetical protein [bacterium]MBT4495682.1 hypothetical protein [bacterium]MBT4763797.1 hypothetical protein [bacterium]